MQVSIDSIKVNRDERQRRELTGLPELADSFSRLGQIQPIVLDTDNVLVAGERRLEAARSLGWTHIEAVSRDELDEPTRRAIELEENIKREELPWQDRCKAVLEYHQLRKAEEPSWSQDDTGTALGIAVATVSQQMGVARELLNGNARVQAAPRFSTARGIVSRATERAAATAIDSIRPASTDEKTQIIHADFHEWALTYRGPKFNFIHCDFPYGIGADKFNQGSAPTHGGYADDEDTYWNLCAVLGSFIDNCCSDQCHIMFWFSMHYYASTRDFFSRVCSIDLDPFPLVWTKSDNIGILPDPERGPRRIYETAFFGSRGDRKIVSAISNSFAHSSIRDEHMSIKPEPVLSNFFRMFVDSSSVILDPTCGSGSSVRAAKGLGAKLAIGIERDEEFAEGARLSLRGI